VPVLICAASLGFDLIESTRQGAKVWWGGRDRRAPRRLPELEGPSRASLALEYPMPFCTQTTCVNGLTAAPPGTEKFCQERGNLWCLSSGMPSSIRAFEASSESQPLFGKEEDTEDLSSRSLSTSTRCTSVCSELESADSIGLFIRL